MEFKTKFWSFFVGCSFTYCLLSIIEATRVTPALVVIFSSIGVSLTVALAGYECSKEFSRRKK